MRRPSRDKRSPEAAAYQHLYWTKRWREMRAMQLLREPYCRMCKVGRPLRATVADHIIPHRGDPVLFWDPKNLQSLCDIHHGEKQRIEMGGKPKATIGVDGWPVESKG